MRYILPCFFAGPIREYHQALVDEIAARFDLPFTRRQAIPAHFTLKYHFETDDIAAVEDLLAGFARAHAAAPLTVGGFGHFDEDVVYVTVTPSPPARATLAELFTALRQLPWMPWSPHDGENLRPHMTVAEYCRPRFAEVWRHVEGRARRFEAALDNLTLLRQVGEEDGITRWTVHRTFPFGACGGGGATPRS
jgi:2'-5' RNA ligase